MSPVEAVLAAALLDAEHLRAELEAIRRERDQLEVELRHARTIAAVGRLAAGLAHDLSNFVAAITGHGELLLRRLDSGDPGLRDSVEALRQTAERGAALAGQLVAACHEEDVADTVVHVNDVVTGSEPLLQRLIGGAGRLQTRLDPDAPPVRANLGQLEQMLATLVMAAGRRLSGDDPLALATTGVSLLDSDAQDLGVRPGRYVRLTVAGDSDDSEAPAVPGLDTVVELVGRLGGTVRVVAGARYEVYLPGLEESGRTTEVEVRPEGLDGAESILVVEDEQSVRELIRDVLRLHGYTVLEARDGDEAAAIGERHPGPIHLLITDLVMPGVPAASLVKRLTTLRPGLKVLCMSGYTDELIRQHGLLRLSPDFLQKPFTVDALARKVRERLDAG